MSALLKYEFLNQVELKSSCKLEKWLGDIHISSKSKFIDEIWFLDGAKIVPDTFKNIYWNKVNHLGFNLSDYPNLLETVKRIIFYVQTTLIKRKGSKALSQVKDYRSFIILINWMFSHAIYDFKEITKEKFTQYIDWLKNDKKSENSIRENIRPFYLLNQYKEYINDKLIEDFLEGKSIPNYLEFRSKSEQTKAIPNEVIEKICAKALPIIDYFYENDFELSNILDQKIIPPLDRVQSTERLKAHYCNILNASAFFIIGLYTGMRLTEILSIKKDAFDINKDNLVIIKSTLYKLTSNNNGIPETWACGLNFDSNYALKAIKVLQKISPNNMDELFFKYSLRKTFNLRTDRSHDIFREFASFCEVDWMLKPHQLRRTFARLIGVSDKTNLLALKEHFKHASLAMTDYYVGTNPDLLEMIGEEKQLEISEGLDIILSSESLAGKLGEKISKSNLKFRGNIEARKEYIKDMLTNSDLIVIPHEYGFCIYQPEQAKCKGETKNVGLNTCTKCNNFAVSPKHKTFWINRVEQYEKFKEQVIDLPNQKVTVEELVVEINEALSIINKISEKEE